MNKAEAEQKERDLSDEEIERREKLRRRKQRGKSFNTRGEEKHG